MRIDETDAYSDYKKFTVETRVNYGRANEP